MSEQAAATTTVEVVEKVLVRPSEPTPTEPVWLSNLDIPLVSRHHTPLIYLYRPNGNPNFFDMEVVKAALSKALVPYYPYAGRLVKGRDGRLEISCTSEGLLFVAARCELSVEELGDFVPSPEMRRMFVPEVPVELPTILFMVQFTKLKDGAVILGTNGHHGATDGYGSMNFLRTWTCMARGAPELAVTPSHDRSPLRARSPPTVLFDHYGNRSVPANATLIKSPSTTVVLKLSKDQLNALRDDRAKKLSAFQLLAGHLWRCTCMARGLAREETTRVYFPVGARNRLTPPLPAAIFANVLCRQAPAVKVADLMDKGASFGAERIKEEVEKVNDEYMRSLIDMLEVRMENGVMALPATDFAVVSWMGMPVYDVDFGWGEPEVVTRASLTHCGYAYVLDGRSYDGEICALVTVEAENREKFLKAFHQGLE